MIQLQSLNGKTAGRQTVVRRFPVRIGRTSSCDVVIEEPGVWENHGTIEARGTEFVFTAQTPALASVNGEAVGERVLRSGDVLELGSAQLRFGLSPTRPRGMRVREALTWGGLILLCVIEAGLLYLLS